MGDKLEGDVTVAALVISLIALVVTVNQLLSQLFNSADGYRRCAESVIDVWSVKRHRVWKWSEFRFETQYVTPQVVLASPLEFLEYEEEYGEIYHINSPMLDDEACKELERTVHQDYCHFRKRKHRVPAAQSSSVDGSKKGSGNDVEKAVTSRKHSRAQAPTRIRTESDPLVSWLRLLRELHQLSHSYWPKDCTTCSLPTWDQNDTGVAPSDFSALYEMDVDEFDEPYKNLSRTDIAVIYRTWTWDFMPSDMVRPLAEVSIGDIIVLAIRMGMKWRALDPEFGKMQADGNGFNLSATDVRGLGVVLRFTAAGSHEHYPRLIPSRAVDKMLLGIVPGDDALVGQDFPMVGSKGEIQDIAGPGGVLSRIGMPENRRNEIRKHENPAVKNDTIQLLAPFLPLKGSTMASYCFPGFHTTPGIWGVHCFWEGRIALHRHLRDRVHSGAMEPALEKTLSATLERMDALESRHGDDWYSRFAWKPSIRNHQEWQTKLAVINEAREIFDWTTKYFVDNGFGTTHEDGMTQYVHLVAAHANMADHACQKAKEFVKNYPHDRGQVALKDAYKIDSHHGYFFVFDVYEIGRRYVDHLHNANHGVKAYLRGRGIEVSNDDAEAAWWVMQLRGITWNFSTWHPDGIVDQMLGGRAVPSSFYGNTTPVWIT